MKTKELQAKVEKVEKSVEVAEIICEFEYIVRGKNRNIIWLAYQQGEVLSV